MRTTWGVIVAVSLTACSAADWNAFWGGFGAANRGGNKALESQGSGRRCYAASDCSDVGAVCMIPEGASQGSCAKPQ